MAMATRSTMNSQTDMRRLMLRDDAEATKNSLHLAKSLMHSMLCPIHVSNTNGVIPGLGNGERLLTVHGNASIKITTPTTTNAICFIDEYSFRAGQLAVYVVERQSNLTVNDISKINVGETSDFLAAGGLISTELYGKNTSGTDTVSGTVSGGTLAATRDSLLGFNASDIAAQTYDSNYINVDAKMSGVSIVNANLPAVHNSPLGESLRLTGSEISKSDTVSGTADTSIESGYYVAVDSKTCTTIHKHLNAGVFNLDVSATLQVTGTGANTNSNVKIISYDWKGDALEEKLCSVVFIGNSAAPGDSMSYAVSECFTNSTFPIASFRIFIQNVSNVTVLGNSQRVTARMIFPTSSEALSRSVVLFEGIGESSTITLSVGALMHVTPQPGRYNNLMGRRMQGQLTYNSVVNDMISVLIQHMPNAFSDTTKPAFLAQLDQYDAEGSLEMAFSLKSFASLAKGIERFGKDAVVARHFISDVAKMVKPMLADAGSVPIVGRFATAAAQGINDAQDIGFLEARTVYP